MSHEHSEGINSTDVSRMVEQSYEERLLSIKSTVAEWLKKGGVVDTDIRHNFRTIGPKTVSFSAHRSLGGGTIFEFPVPNSEKRDKFSVIGNEDDETLAMIILMQVGEEPIRFGKRSYSGRINESYPSDEEIERVLSFGERIRDLLSGQLEEYGGITSLAGPSEHVHTMRKSNVDRKLLQFY